MRVKSQRQCLLENLKVMREKVTEGQLIANQAFENRDFDKADWMAKLVIDTMDLIERTEAALG